MATGSLILVRPKQWCDRLRDYRIIVDGVEVGRLGPAAEIRLELSEGEHQILARIDWARASGFPVLTTGGKAPDRRELP